MGEVELNTAILDLKNGAVLHLASLLDVSIKDKNLVRAVDCIVSASLLEVALAQHRASEHSRLHQLTGANS